MNTKTNRRADAKRTPKAKAITAARRAVRVTKYGSR